jgi:hypothetical protein
MSADLLDESIQGIRFNYEDSISGNGYFASYNKIVAQGPFADARVYSRLANVALLKKDHGSGSIERESVLRSTELTYSHIDPDLNYAYGVVAASDNYAMVYSPLTMSIGSGYYSTHPVNFNSLLEGMIQIKNYASKTSMGHEINYAHAINMDLVTKVEDDYLDTGVSRGLAKSSMDLNGGVTEGTAHLTMLQGGIRKSKSVWSKPDIDVDQIYTGTFDFATNMNLIVPVAKIEADDDWLPCCFGGYLTMPTYYQKGSKGFGSNIKGVFDCTAWMQPGECATTAVQY